MIDWDKELVAAIGRRRSVIVIGSGVSKNSADKNGVRPMTWEEFLYSCADKCGNPAHVLELISKKDYLTSCEIIKDILNRDDRDSFSRLVEATFMAPGFKPALIHEHIYNLDSSIVLTPNFDCIYDTYATAVSNSTVSIKDHTSKDLARFLLGGDIRLLIKSHGSVRDPANLIFTRNDYAQARTKFVLFYEILKSLILTHTFLFVGCGIDDPDIRLLFEDVQFTFGRMPLHYMTLPENEAHEDILKISSNSMRLKFLKYNPIDGHAELTSDLKKLVDLVEAYRQQISVDMKW
jgi:hypothetical protein